MKNHLYERRQCKDRRKKPRYYFSVGRVKKCRLTALRLCDSEQGKLEGYPKI